jgi:hypothetical protein
MQCLNPGVGSRCPGVVVVPQKNKRVKVWNIEGFRGTCGEVGEGKNKKCLNPGLGPEPRRRGGPPSHPF